MVKKVNYIGKDGGWYDNYGEYRAANTKYEQQEKQNELIEHQNKTLELQNRLIEQQNQLNYQLEQEKIRKNYELEMNKLKHEEKMRILNLFDNVGISMEVYNTYIDTTFMNQTTKELLKQRDEHLLMSSKYEFLLHHNEKLAELGLDAVMEIKKKYNMHDLDNKISVDCYDKVSKAKQKEKEDLIIKAKRAKRCLVGSGISAPISLALFIAVCEGPEFAVYTLMILMICIATTLIVSGCVWSQTEKQINEMPEKDFNLNKYHNKLNALIGQEVEMANKLTETIKNDNKKQVDTLYNFRLNHYNASIEKLLVDVGFKELIESLGIEYKRVNNSNKKKDGTIEDYVEYFESNS